MESFENCKVITKANIYFDGNVQSRTIYLPDGERKTLGVILPGEYEFGTGVPEIMDIISGMAHILIAGTEDWKSYAQGVSFPLPANTKFKMKCNEVTEYVCSYISE